VKPIVGRKRNRIDHVMRRKGLLGEVVDDRMEGKKPRGKRRMEMMEELYKKESHAIVKRRAEDRILWKCWKPQTCQ